MGGTNPPYEAPDIATVVGNISTPTLTPSDTIVINGITVVILGTDLASLINDINNANITGIGAANNGSNQLQITGTNVNIDISNGLNTPLAALGIVGDTYLRVPSADTRSRDANSTVLGAVDGTDEATIGVNNLPEHKHDMRSEDGGIQFTAIRAVDGRGGDKPGDATVSTIQTGADTLSQTINDSGGVLSPQVGDDLNVMNPYQTINYIIYTGVVS